jgi:rRNA maturation RNase YbeY
MKIYLQNQQNQQPLNLPTIHNLSQWLGSQIETPQQRWGDVTLLLTNDTGITQYNREYFAKNHPTDVISFRHDPIPGESNHLTGDLIINVQRAHEEGTQRGDRNFELAFYIAHGFDHLNGATDETPEKRTAMHRREKQWLQQATEANLLTNLFT